MFVKNFQSIFCNSSAALKYMNGSTYNGLLYSANVAINSSGCHYGGNGYAAFHVIIGAGDTPVTVDDYDLADASIMASDKMQSQNQSTSSSRNNGTVVNTQWYNSSAAPITVKEIGLAFKNNPNSPYSKSVNILAARKVLDTPVTIQPGETYVFTYRVSVE